jgi:hypothetical protein
MITNYSDLKSEIANWLHRDDLETNIPIFIQLAESKIAKNIRSRYLETVSTHTITGGSETFTIPFDYSSIKSIVVESNPRSPLEIVPDHILQQYNQNSTTSVPKFYTITGSNIYFSPIPDSNYTTTITYNSDLIPLSSVNNINWVLTRYPYLYLYGALIEASIYTNDPDQVQFYQSKFDDAIKDIWENYNDQSFSGSVLRARSDYVV